MFLLITINKQNTKENLKICKGNKCSYRSRHDLVGLRSSHEQFPSYANTSSQPYLKTLINFTFLRETAPASFKMTKKRQIWKTFS